MPQVGVFVCGMFIGSEVKEFDGKPKYSVGVAVGLECYKIYMQSGEGLELLGLGDMVEIKCRPYAGQRGLGWSDGVLLKA